ncbi:uncharacterized protein VTP21DRAFT_9591 [Calcarisporiella thermophila]|uniref:uncharacterized protein n=1 Tax=Calcarisporiella thermophila TaxID=911321 RepID=UPI003743043F
MTVNDEGRRWVRPEYFYGDINEDPVECINELVNIRRVNRRMEETVIEMSGYYSRDEESTGYRMNEARF